MAKLDVNQELRKAIAKDIKECRFRNREEAKCESTRVEVKKRGDDMRSAIEIDKLINHDDNLYYESLLDD